MASLLSRVFTGSHSAEPTWIEPADLRQRLAAGDPVLVLDVRGADEFAGSLGHIGGAVNLPLPELPAYLAELAADKRAIIAVCLTDKRSARAAVELAAAGHRDVAVLRGGMDRWRREGFAEPALRTDGASGG
jgi:rhodanese-related sulfurtransferase